MMQHGRLYDTCGVHHVSTKDGMDIYMLVEREYPLSRHVLTQMLVLKLFVEQDNEMSRELRKIFMQTAKGIKTCEYVLTREYCGGQESRLTDLAENKIDLMCAGDVVDFRTWPGISLETSMMSTMDLDGVTCLTVLQRISELEKKVEALSKVDHSEAIEESIQANVLNEVRNQIPKFLPKAVSEFIEPRLERTVHGVLKKNSTNPIQSSFTQANSLSELELMNILFDKMHNSGSFLDHDKHLDLYKALMNSIGLDEIIEKGDLDPAKVLKRKCNNDDDQDPPADINKEKKKRFKEPVLEVAIDVEEPILYDVTWFNDLVNADKYPLTFDDLMATPIHFTKFFMNRLKKDKITKADLVGPVYKLLKGTCRSNIELEYNIEKCYLALIDQLDWLNPENDGCPYDLSKPLPLQGSLGHLTIPVDFFFNNDLKYLKTGNKERKYTTSITKIKAARISQHEVYSTMKILSVIRVKVDKQFGYGYFEEIVNKLFNLPGDDIVNLVISLRMFTRSFVTKKRIKDVQLGLESYQKKFNITKPQNTFAGISFKEPYTTSYDPNGSVRKILHERLLNFVLGFNKDMPNRKGTDKDQIWTDTMVKKIDNQLLERQIMRSLEGLVGGRKVETDYRLLLRTV
ncbi:hypothetical protein Tco_0693970 [Tanacetum coccineum]